MSDYATPDGIFLKVYQGMPNELLLPFKSTEHIGGKTFEGGVVVADDGEQGAVAQPPKKNKVKYTCSCDCNVWGKPKLHIICGECKAVFQMQT